MGSRASVGRVKLDYRGVGDVLRSDEVMSMLEKHGRRIESDLNTEGRGEFRAFEGNRRTRDRVFVTTYDRHAKRTANADPSIFSRHIR